MSVEVLPSDVAAGWRPLSEGKVVTATGLIAEALVILSVEVPALDSKPDATVKLVVTKMVRRVLKNPDGYRIRTESIDDYTDGGTVDSSLSTGELYISERELKWLGIVETGRAFEVRLG